MKKSALIMIALLTLLVVPGIAVAQGPDVLYDDGTIEQGSSTDRPPVDTRRIENPRRTFQVEERERIERREIEDSEDDDTQETERVRARTVQTVQTHTATQTKDQATIERHERLTQTFVARLENRFSFYEQRLENILSKLQDRIDRLTDRGFDTSAAQEKLDEAVAAFEDAQSAAAETVTTVGSLDSTSVEGTSELVQEIRNETSTALAAYKQVITLIKETIQVLRGVVADGQSTSSTN